MRKIRCHKHGANRKPYLVCGHITEQGAPVAVQIRPEDDPDDICGQLLCAADHSAPAGQKPEPRMYCDGCVADMLRDGKN